MRQSELAGNELQEGESKNRPATVNVVTKVTAWKLPLSLSGFTDRAKMKGGH